MNPEPASMIYSFIIRFVVENAPHEAGEHPTYHGAIRHIQSAEELIFNEWGEAVEFMRRFVPIPVTNDRSKPIT